MMFARALLAFLVLPGFFAGVLPLLLVSADPWHGSGLGWAGAVAFVPGLVVLLWCVRDFYVAGKGTLAPWDPPKRLVVVGLYRYMRNPMYVGVLLIVAAWSLTLTSPLLALYLVGLAIGFHLRVVLNEEPWLTAQFGDDWKEYSATVPRWLPRSGEKG